MSELDSSDVPVLAGWTVGITAARRREEFGSALERRGATIVYGPAIRIVPLVDDTELLDATKRCLAQPLDYVVATTGVGFRGWMEAARTWGLADGLVESFAASAILTRGPKVRGAVRAAGLREQWSPESESSAEVLEHMLAIYDLDGRRVAVQLHGEPLPGFVEAMAGAGADVIEVPVYRWVSPEDEQPLRHLIEATAARTVDAVTFTSAPAAVNFLRTAEAAGLGEQVRDALRGPVMCAAVGPVTAAPLLQVHLHVVQPERSRLGALIREIVEGLPLRATVLRAGGHDLEIRGQAAVVDGALVPLSGVSMTLLRALSALPGKVVARDTLSRLLPGDSADGDAVEVAIDGLRVELGDPAVVATVGDRGYRLGVDR